MNILKLYEFLDQTFWIHDVIPFDRDRFDIILWC